MGQQPRRPAGRHPPAPSGIAVELGSLPVTLTHVALGTALSHRLSVRGTLAVMLYTGAASRGAL
jgi:hypothetical protein